MAEVRKGGEWKSEKILEKRQAIFQLYILKKLNRPPPPIRRPLGDTEELEFLLVAVLGIEPRALCKLGKCLPRSHILSPVLNIWRARTRTEPGRQRGSRQRTDEHGHTVNAIRFLTRKGRRKGSDRMYVSGLCFSTHTPLHIFVCVVFWYRTQSLECCKDRAVGCELTPILQNEHTWVSSLKKAERSGLIKVGFPPMFQFLNHMWHHSLMPLQIAIG